MPCVPAERDAVVHAAVSVLPLPASATAVHSRRSASRLVVKATLP
jgi:hypothetical protein